MSEALGVKPDSPAECWTHENMEGIAAYNIRSEAVLQRVQAYSAVAVMEFEKISGGVTSCSSLAALVLVSL